MMIRYTLRRVLAATFAVALMLMTLPAGVLTVSAETTYKEGYYTYTVTDGKATITDCNISIRGDVTLPSMLGGYPVTTIGDEVFYECYSLTSITIPNSVTTIGNGAFFWCDSLTSITIPNSVTTIGVRAFYGCESLISITIPNSVTTIGDGAFYECNSLTSITIPNSVTTIGNKAFYGCSSLTSITIPNSVTTIINGAFGGCDSLTSIEVDDGNTVYHAKDNCLIETATDTLIQGCQTSVIPDYVTTIGDGAFFCCYSLTSITIPNSVTTIGNYAFSWCTSLTSITIPNSVTTIGDDAFFYCYSLTSITIPNSVITIGDGAFYDCNSLTDVWYIGADRSDITIGSDNDALLNAAWHYVDTCPDEHQYSAMCDKICDVCDFEREAETGHVYTHIHDASCNECRDIRTVPDHVYTHIHDPSCNECGDIRTVPEHVYDNACDIDCNECGEPRTVPDHVYDNAYDTVCDECNITRPQPPVVFSFTDSSVSLIAADGYEYSMDGETWQTDPTFTGLSPATTYAFYQRSAGTDRSAAAYVTTDKAEQAAVPAAPTVQSVTATTITLNIVDGCEYSMDGKRWQESPTFTDLTPLTVYTFYQRYAETATHYVGRAGAATYVTTDKATLLPPAAPTLAYKTANTIVLEAHSGYEYSIGGVEWQTSPVFTGLSPKTNYMVYQRLAETDDHYATAASSALIVKTEASPLLDGIFNADDVQLVWHSVVGLIPPLSAEEIAEADQNGDGIVNLHDAARLFYMVNGLI